MLLDEYERWTGDARPGPRAGAGRPGRRWTGSTTTATATATATSSTRRRNPETGLDNQCWKDSWNSIVLRRRAARQLPRATCEIQGYAYDAKVRTRPAGPRGLGRRGAGRAAGARGGRAQGALRPGLLAARPRLLRARPGRRQAPVDTLTSNIGHLLWSGIVDDDKVEAVRRPPDGRRAVLRLGRADDGRRASGGYNPIGYHNGTVWPHDTSLIAAGLAPLRLPRRRPPGSRWRMLEAAELLRRAGCRRRSPATRADATRFPVEYPTACSPAGVGDGRAAAHVLRVMLGLEPSGSQLMVDRLAAGH